MQPISVNIITKDQVKPTLTCIESLLGTLVTPDDEIVVVDTGSNQENLNSLKYYLKQIDERPDCPCVKLVARPDLSVPLADYIRDWLPEFTGKLERDPQYKDLRGILDFAAARNVAVDESKNEWIFWIDSDDVLREKEPGHTRRVFEKVMIDRKEYDALFMEYQYAFAEDGTLTTTLKRERFFPKSKFRWKGRCHETAIPINGFEATKVRFCEDLKAAVVHSEARKKHQVSDIRNYIILRNELEQLPEGEIPDPRTLFYIGNACRGLARHQEAIEFYKNFINVSGSEDDRFAAAYYIAATYMHPDMRRPIDAMDWYFKCVEIKPLDPRGYFGLSRTYMAQHKYHASLFYFQQGQNLPEPTHAVHSYDPTHVRHRPYLVAAEAARELGRKDEAMQYADIALKARPNDPETQKYHQFIQHWHAGVYLAESLSHVAQHVKGGVPMAKKLMQRVYEDIPAVPIEMEKSGVGRVETLDPRPDRPEISIFCGGTLEEWGPQSAKSGIGGSEKMVLLLAPELQKLGYNVTVYASVPFPYRGIDDNGVRWSHFSEIDMHKPRQALIAWRGKQHAFMSIPAEKRILWLHDVQNPAEYTPELLATVDYVQVQSKYHAEPLIGVVPEEKIWYARNAIEVPKVKLANKDPKKVVYLSCPTRGALTALEILKAAKRHDPSLNMTIMYGFSPFERKVRSQHTHRHLPDLARDCCVDDYERLVTRTIDETGTRLLHRVGFEQVSRELESAGVWLYPTRFPEISCMAAMEAQAHGVIPVASTFGALDETILAESRVWETTLGTVPNQLNEQWLGQAAAKLIKAAKVQPTDVQRQIMIDGASAAFNVKALAKEWAEKIGGL